MTALAPPAAELRLGLVGFGKLVRDYYLPALPGLAGARVVAVADPLPDSRRVASQRLPGVALYSGHQAMLDGDGLDGVLVASPPSTHLEVWSEAAARGLPSFVEKPLLLSRQLASLAVRDEPRLMVDFNRRFWPAYSRVRDLGRQGVFGAPVHLEFALHLDVVRWSGVTRHRLDFDEGGLLHDLGGHAIDLALEVVGQEPDHVTAVTSSRQRMDDQLRLRLDFPDGSSASCDLGYGDRTREWLVVRGPEKTARLAEPNKALHVYPVSVPRGPLLRWSRDAVALGYRAFRRSQSMGRASIRGALSAFIHALRTNVPFAPGFADGLRNARWVAAAARSVASGGLPQRP